jgi:hypothetical protein
MTSALGFTVVPSELATHANVLNQLSGQVGQAQGQAQSAMLGGQAFGVISVALAFANLIKGAATPGISALSQAQSVLSTLSKTISTTATNYGNVEQSNASRFQAGGLTGTPGSSTNSLFGTTTPNAASKNSGASILTDVSSLEKDISSGNWIQGGLAGMKVVSDIGGIMSNPIGAVTQFGFNFLIQHVKPLQEAVGWLVGSPGQVSQYGSSWQNVAKTVMQAGTLYNQTLGKDTANWTGAAANSYHATANDKINLLSAVSSATSAVGNATQVVGQLVGKLQKMIQDMVSKAMQQIIQTAMGASFMISIPVVVSEVVQEVVSWMKKIADVIKMLTTAFNTLQPLLSGVTQLFGTANKSLGSGVQALPTIAPAPVAGISMPTPVGRTSPLIA